MADVRTFIGQQLADVQGAIKTAEDYSISFARTYLDYSAAQMDQARYLITKYGVEGIAWAASILADARNVAAYASSVAPTSIHAKFVTANARVVQAFDTILTAVEGWIASAATAAYDYFNGKIDGLQDFIAKAFDVVISQVEYSVGGAWTAIQGQLSNIATALNAQLLDIAAKLLPAMSALKDGLLGAIGQIPALTAAAVIAAFFVDVPESELEWPLPSLTAS